MIRVRCTHKSSTSALTLCGGSLSSTVVGQPSNVLSDFGCKHYQSIDVHSASQSENSIFFLIGFIILAPVPRLALLDTHDVVSHIQGTRMATLSTLKWISRHVLAEILFLLSIFSSNTVYFVRRFCHACLLILASWNSMPFLFPV